MKAAQRYEDPEQLGTFERTMSTRRELTMEERVDHVSRALRIVGTLIFISAAATFLLQRWGVADDIERYLSLLGMTALLPAAGLLCGLGFREGKSARTLLGALITILPVHFAVLGGLVYSQFAWDASAAMAPAYALWQGSSTFSVILTVSGATVVLAVLTWFAHATFVRVRARQMTLAALALNALLLIPLRTPWVAAAIAGLAAVAVVSLDSRWLRAHPELRTPEGRWARGLLYVPSALIVARAINLYPVDAAFFALTLLGAGAVAVAWSFRGTSKSVVDTTIAILAFCAAAFFEAIALGDHLSLWVAITTAGLSTSGILLGVAYAIPKARSFAIPSAIVLALVATLLAGWLGESTVACAIGLAVGIAAAAYGYLSQRSLVMLTGVVQVGGSAVVLWQSAVSDYGIGTWGGLALVGVLTVVATSFLERWSRARKGAPSAPTAAPAAAPAPARLSDAELGI